MDEIEPELFLQQEVTAESTQHLLKNSEKYIHNGAQNIAKKTKKKP